VYGKLDRRGGALLLEFASPDDAARAVHALHWRWYGGRRLQAAFLDELEFQQRI